MRYSLALCLVCVFAVGVAQGQKSNQREREQYVSLPREIGFPVVAVQPGCPLQFEKAERLLGLDGRGANDYSLRNRGTKPIRAFTVSYTFVDGTGGSWSWQSSSGELILPGQLVPSSSAGDEDSEVITLTEGLRDKLKLRGPMKGMIIYMIERVEFADGSTYDDEATAKALKAYLGGISDKAYRADQHKCP